MSAPVVLVSGALTGIGRATALAFAREGAKVVASGRRELEGKKLEDSAKAPASSSTSPRPTTGRVAPGPPSMSQASTPSKGSPRRPHSRWLGLACE
jgi:NAD(P)-dependent dehydrogenase (short-subunit alcohol dehydrogenase family)